MIAQNAKLEKIDFRNEGKLSILNVILEEHFINPTLVANSEAE